MARRPHPQMLADDAGHARRDACIAELGAFLQRAADEGLLRQDQPRGQAVPLLPELVNLAWPRTGRHN